LKQRFFQVMIRLYSVEPTVSWIFVSCCLCVYHLVFLLSVVPVAQLVGSRVLEQVNNSWLGMVACPVFLVAILISYRDVFRKEARIDDHAPLARISIYLMISFTYVVYPFSVWTLAVKIY
jgi:hypothetical protein